MKREKLIKLLKKKAKECDELSRNFLDDNLGVQAGYEKGYALGLRTVVAYLIDLE